LRGKNASLYRDEHPPNDSLKTGEVRVNEKRRRYTTFGGSDLMTGRAVAMSPNLPMRPKSIDQCFRQKVIPVTWSPGTNRDVLGRASTVFLQGGSLRELAPTLDEFSDHRLARLPLFIHIDLLSGLENSEAGLEYLAELDRVSGIVTVHHHLSTAARKLGLLSIVRLFVSDSRAADRGLSIANKSRPDAIEILPAAAAPKVAADFAGCRIPRIAGGLCRTEADVDEVLASGCLAVTSTSPTLWKLNPGT
jgi:glycerol uptake operon antiterminator